MRMPYADPEVRRIYHRDYKRRNRWRYAPSQALYDRTKHANERAAKYGAPGRLTLEDVRVVMAAGRCHYCGSTERLCLDHVIGLHLQGPNTPANIVCSCLSCNLSKHRADRPRRWSQTVEACVECGTTERKHSARGRCNACYIRTFGKPRPRLTSRRVRKGLPSADR